MLALPGPAPAGYASAVGAGRRPAPAPLLGAKAARLAAARQAGLPVLPGWVVPVDASHPAVRAGAAAVRSRGLAAGRRAVLGLPVDETLATELREAVRELGGRVIVRSSSPLEAGTGWSGAFSSVSEVGPADVTVAVRSCWAAAFAADPLERLAACGLPLEALELGLLLQPELRPDAGGVAWLTGDQVTVEGAAGHPAALLSGWAEGTQAQLRLRPDTAQPHLVSDAGLGGLLGRDLVTAVAGLAGQAHQALGDDLIEWAAAGGTLWLLQSARRAVPAERSGVLPSAAAPRGPLALPVPPDAAAGDLAARKRMPLLAALVQARGRHIPARPAVPGTAAGRLVPCRPHERPGPGSRDAILLIDRPLPALAPLLFGARGVIARAGAAGSHLAEVARSLGVPMVIGCRLDPAAGQHATGQHVGQDAGGQHAVGQHAVGQDAGGQDAGGQEWIAAIDGAAGDVALLPASALSLA